MDVVLVRQFVPAPVYVPNPVPNMPIDHTHLLRPSRILYLRTGSGRTHSEAIDMSMQLLPSYNDLLDADFYDSLYNTIRANPDLHPTWLASREHRLRNSDITVKELDPYGGVSKIAKLHAPILAFGTTMISFPRGSDHCAHKLTVFPLSTTSRAQCFVKDKVYHMWDTTEKVTRAERASGRLSLYKAGSVEKVEVARYASLNGKFEVGGVLLVEEREVDALVALLTVLGTLGQKTSLVSPWAK